MEEVDAMGAAVEERVFPADRATIGYALALVLMALGGWPCYELLADVLSFGTLYGMRLYQAFLFGGSFLALAAVANAHRGERWWTRRLMRLAALACLVCFLGGAGLLAFALAVRSRWSAWAAATLLPCARALALTLWVPGLCRRGDAYTGRSVPLAWLASGLLLMPLQLLGEWPTTYLSILAAVALASFWWAWTSDAPEADGEAVCAPIRGKMPDLWVLVTFAAVLNLASALIHNLIVPSESIYGFSSGAIQSVSKVVAAGLLLAVTLRKGRFTAESLFTWVVGVYIVVVSCGALLFFLHTSTMAAISLFTGIASAVVSIVVPIAALQRARGNHFDPVVVFGLFSGLFYVLMAVGNTVGVYSDGLAADSDLTYLVVSMLSIYALSLLFFVVSRVYGLRRERVTAARQAVRAEGLPELLSERCRQLAEDAGLSAREREVLFPLAQGRDALYIAAKLGIGESTVRSHIKSIYRRLGIHSRQELFERVNEGMQ